MKAFILLVVGVCAYAQESRQLRAPREGWLTQATQWKVAPTTERTAAEGRIHAVLTQSDENLQFQQTPDGERTLVLKLEAGNGAAMRLHFENFRLPQGAQLFVYGLSEQNEVTRIAGPYTKSGPLDSGEFWARAVPGSQAIVELQLSEELAQLPFAIPEVGILDGIEERVELPELAQAIERRVSLYRGAAIEHAVIDGYAVWEGDILLGRIEELQPYTGRKTTERQAFGTSSSSSRWPGGIVPYTIDPAVTNQARITDAIAHWNTNLSGTIQIVPRTTQTSYITFVLASSAGTCSSYVGNIGIAGQPINIGDYCSTGNMIHEIGHSIGLYHEHTRTDRDTYVRVNTANIDPAMMGNFNIVSSGLNLGAYDYGSIMHYPAYGFSINGLPTIDTIPAGIAIGQRSALSAGDMAGVRSMYTATAPPPPSSTTVTVTIASSPSGRTVTVDGTSVVTPATRTWTVGSVHSVSAPENTAGTIKYVFSKWSDNGAQTHNYTAPSTAATLTATYRTKYQLRTSASDPVKGTVGNTPATTDGFYDANSTVTVNAAALAGSCFTSWSGILPVSSFSTQLTMTQAYAVTGNFVTGAVTFPTALTAPASASTLSIPVSATTGCLWKATENASWLSLKTTAGTSSTSLQVSVSKNSNRSPRTGTVTINGRGVTITQAGR